MLDRDDFAYVFQTAAAEPRGAVVQTSYGRVRHHKQPPWREREREREREDWSALRAVSRLECEIVLLSFFEIPFQLVFCCSKNEQSAGSDMVETEELSSSSGFTPSHPEIPALRMEWIANPEHAVGSRDFCLATGKTLRWRKRSKL